MSAEQGTGDVTTEAQVPEPIELTPEQTEDMKKALQEFFDIFDLDKDGYVDASEVETVLRKVNDDSSNDVHIALTEEQIKNLSDEFFTDADANADAKVSFDELFSAVLKKSGYKLPPRKGLQLRRL